MKKFGMALLASLMILGGAGQVAHAAAGEWVKQGASWTYQEAEGNATGWRVIGKKRYFFNEDGIMLTKWQQIDDVWYYFKKGGAAVTGWQQIGSKWYLFDTEGRMLTGWQKNSGKWYYMLELGAMHTGWLEERVGEGEAQQVNWYYLDKSGKMVKGWKKDGSKWYYLRSNGTMYPDNRWAQIGGKWYYFNKGGSMATGTRKIGGATYKFGSSGGIRLHQPDGFHRLPAGMPAGSGYSIGSLVPQDTINTALVAAMKPSGYAGPKSSYDGARDEGGLLNMPYATAAHGHDCSDMVEFFLRDYVGFNKLSVNGLNSIAFLKAFEKAGKLYDVPASVRNLSSHQEFAAWMTEKGYLPGTILFHSNNNTKTSIYHVSLYLGEGLIMDAGRNGTTIRYASFRDTVALGWYSNGQQSAEWAQYWQNYYQQNVYWYAWQ